MPIRTTMLAVGILLCGAAAAQAQTRACLHGQAEIPQEQARRRAALNHARAINTAEQNAAGATHAFVPLANLSGVPAPPDGFKVQLVTDGTGYLFSIKDTRDPCAFAIFSDEDGVIYYGDPIGTIGTRFIGQ